MRELIGWTLVALAVAYVLAVVYVALFRGPGTRRRPLIVPREYIPQAPAQWLHGLMPDPHRARWRRWSEQCQRAIKEQHPTMPKPIPDEAVWRARHPRATWGATWAPPHPAERNARRGAPFDDDGPLVRPYAPEYPTPERQDA